MSGDATTDARELPGQTDRYLCSISSCDWHYDTPSLPTRRESIRALQVGVEQVLTERTHRIDSALREHFETHTLLEWLTEVQQARAKADAAMAELVEKVGEADQLRAQLDAIGETREEWRYHDDAGPFVVSRRPLSDADVRYLEKQTGQPVEHRLVGEWRQIKREEVR